MSTRCQIGFYEPGNKELLKPDALLYRHWDGYPGGVLPNLVPFLQEFHQRRGLDDTEYAAAWCMHDQIERAIQRHKEQWKDPLMRYGREDGRGFTGFGVCKAFHGDIEFYYAVFNYAGGPTLKVYSVGPWADDHNPDKAAFKLEKTINLTGKPPLVRKW